MQIRDTEWCGDLGELGASCFWTFKEGKRRVDKDVWDEERFGQVCTKSDNFAHWKASILKLCKLSKLCTYEDIQDLNRFHARIETLEREAHVIRQMSFARSQK